MEVTLKCMKEITDRLAAPINEEDQVVTLLGSLPLWCMSLVISYYRCVYVLNAVWTMECVSIVYV